MRGVLQVSLAALLLAGCGSSREPVPLLTSTEPDPFPEGTCYLSYGQGELIEDATNGTAVRNEDGIYVLRWPMGYTAQRSDETVEVLDRSGNVVAVTGRSYRFFGASWGDPPGPVYSGGPGCAMEIDSSSE